MTVERLVVPVGVVTLAAAALFIGYGGWAGLVRRRILGRARGEYNTGRRAAIQGALYVAIGLAFLVGGLGAIAGGLLLEP